MIARNDWEFKVFGMKRSGHHAIVIWLAHHFPPNSVHYINDAVPFLDPFLFHAHSGATTIRSNSFVNREEGEIKHQRHLHKPCLIYSYEERDLMTISGRHPVPRKLKTVGPSLNELTLLVLRDPFNLAASRLKCHFRYHSFLVARTIQLWTIYAQEFIGLTNHLGPKILVNYNQWFSDPTYRQNLSKTIGLVHTDGGLNRVARNGAGSSWDRVAMDGRAQEMRVLDRWQDYASDSDFCRLFSGRNDVKSISEKVFGHIPGTSTLFRSTPL